MVVDRWLIGSIDVVVWLVIANLVTFFFSFLDVSAGPIDILRNNSNSHHEERMDNQCAL